MNDLKSSQTKMHAQRFIPPFLTHALSQNTVSICECPFSTLTLCYSQNFFICFFCHYYVITLAFISANRFQEIHSILKSTTPIRSQVVMPVCFLQYHRVTLRQCSNTSGDIICALAVQKDNSSNTFACNWHNPTNPLPYELLITLQDSQGQISPIYC